MTSSPATVRRHRVLLALAAAGLMVLAGCAAGPARFEVPEDAPAEVRQEGVDDPVEIVLTVRAEHRNGTRLPGAAVAAFTTPDVELMESAPYYAYTGDADPADPGDRPEREDVGVARTDEDGQVRLYLDPGTPVAVAVGDVPGYTNEVRDVSFLGGPGEQVEVVVLLYRTERPVDLEGVLPSDQGVTGTHNEILDLSVHSDHRVNHAYMDRLYRIELELTWTNLPDGYADLYAAMGPAHDPKRWQGEDERQTPLDQEPVEHLKVDGDQLGGLRPSGGYYVAAMTDRVAVGLDGVPFRFEGTAWFRGAHVAFIDGDGDG